MPKDDSKLSRFSGLVPSRAQLESFKKMRVFPELLPERLRQLAENQEAIEALVRKRAARPGESRDIEREIAALREAIRLTEGYRSLARSRNRDGERADAALPTIARETTSPTAPRRSARRLVRRRHRRRRSTRRAPWCGVSLLKTSMPGESAAKVREAMGGRIDGTSEPTEPTPDSWIDNEGKRLKRKLRVPSESTIQRELNERFRL